MIDWFFSATDARSTILQKLSVHVCRISRFLNASVRVDVEIPVSPHTHLYQRNYFKLRVYCKGEGGNMVAINKFTKGKMPQLEEKN